MELDNVWNNAWIPREPGNTRTGNQDSLRYASRFGLRCESRTRRINDLSWTTRADNNLQGWRAGLTRLCQSRTRFQYRLSRFAVARGFSSERERQGKRGGSLPCRERLFIRREGKIRDKLTPSFLRPRQIRLTRHCVSVIDRKSRDSTESYRKFHEQEKRREIGEIFKELRVAKTFDRTNVARERKKSFVNFIRLVGRSRLLAPSDLRYFVREDSFDRNGSDGFLIFRGLQREHPQRCARSRNN